MLFSPNEDIIHTKNLGILLQAFNWEDKQDN